jgi:mRNA interferase MazF
MIKARPVIVVSPRLPHRDGLCTVVPLSGTPPARHVDYVVEFKFDPPLPYPFVYEIAWAKCDMLATVAFKRLDLFRSERDQTGKRKYIAPKLPAEDFEKVQRAVLCALGLT